MPGISAAAADTRTFGDLTVSQTGFGAKRLPSSTVLDPGNAGQWPRKGTVALRHLWQGQGMIT